MKRSTGFTLIEMIMVITITGVIAGMVAVFIRAPVEAYVDSVRRAELTDQAEVALRRITRDVRLALPNSLREVTVNQSFEFIITKSGGRYRDETDGSNCATGNCLNFLGDTSFDVLGSAPEIAANDHIVIYNLGVAGADAYAGDNRAQVQTPGNTVTLTASKIFPFRSPGSRFQIVDRNEQVVRYTCDGTTLTRATLCSLGSAGCTATSAPLAGGGTTTATCPVINYTDAAIGRSGLLYISLTLTSGGESVTLFNQIHVDNVP